MIEFVSDPIPWKVVNNFDILILLEPFFNSIRNVVVDPCFKLDDDTFAGFVVLERGFDDFLNESDAQCTNGFEYFLFWYIYVDAWYTNCLHLVCFPFLYLNHFGKI